MYANQGFNDNSGHSKYCHTQDLKPHIINRAILNKKCLFIPTKVQKVLNPQPNIICY